MGNRKFIVSLRESDTKMTKAFLADVKSKGGNWWNWVTNTWLIVDQRDTLDINTLTNLVKNHFPNVIFIINEVEIINWKGFGPNEVDSDKKTGKPIRNMFTWLHNNWKIF